MKGNIYSQQRCPSCGGPMVHDERRGNCFCRSCNIAASGQYIVKFGREVNKRFPTYAAALQFLYGLRYKTVEHTFDARDYKKDQPLGFETQARRWLEIKKEQVKESSWRNLRNYMDKAIAAWSQINVKAISYGHIEDFLFSKTNFSSDKTRANARSCLSDFFHWLKKREGIPIPDMPDCKFDLGRRTITTWEVQRQITERIHQDCDDWNPKIAFGVELLATYISLRPDDLRRVREEDFNPSTGWLTIHNPTKRKNTFKTVRLTDEHADRWRELQSQFPGLPNAPFFRHTTPVSGHKTEGDGFGPKLLYVHWRKACDALGIANLDLYGGTRHTTATELARVAGHENTRKATGHLTNKAFDRYCQAQDQTAFDMAKIVSEAREGKVVPLKRKATD
jgi:hypothetical protein